MKDVGLHTNNKPSDPKFCSCHGQITELWNIALWASYLKNLVVLFVSAAYGK